MNPAVRTVIHTVQVNSADEAWKMVANSTPYVDISNLDQSSVRKAKESFFKKLEETVCNSQPIFMLSSSHLYSAFKA